MKTLILSFLLASVLISVSAHADYPNYPYIPYGGPSYGWSKSIFGAMTLGGSPYPAGSLSNADILIRNLQEQALRQQTASGLFSPYLIGSYSAYRSYCYYCFNW